MNPLTVHYKLKLKGYTLSRVAEEVGVSKQVVWQAVRNNRQRGKSALVWKKILQVID